MLDGLTARVEGPGGVGSTPPHPGYGEGGSTPRHGTRKENPAILAIWEGKGGIGALTVGGLISENFRNIMENCGIIAEKMRKL